MPARNFAVVLALSAAALSFGLSRETLLASQNEVSSLEHFDLDGIGKKLTKYLQIDETGKVDPKIAVDKVIALDKAGKLAEAREAAAILNATVWPPQVGYLARAKLKSRHGDNVGARLDERYAEGLRLLLEHKTQEARQISNELLSTDDGKDLGFKLKAEVESTHGNISQAQDAVVQFMTLTFDKLRSEEAKYFSTFEGRKFLSRISNNKTVDYSTIPEGKPVECVEFEWVSTAFWPQQVLGEHGAAMIEDRLKFPDRVMDDVIFHKLNK